MAYLDKVLLGINKRKGLFLFKVINNSYKIRTEMYAGTEHLVVPATMMLQGVHVGSGGPMLHLSEELGKYPETWNGIPVVVSHPMNADGQYISANSPEVLDSEIVGRVFHTRMDGEKLKSEVWLNVDRLSEISPEALAAIQDQEPLDVSVGVISDLENLPGMFEGEEYNSIARNVRPDHLALLPGEEGACSWNDGCGIRANSVSKFKKKGEDNVKAETLQMVKTLHIAGYSISEIANYVETGYKELIDQIWNKLQGMGNNNVWYYLEELYDDSLVYTKSGEAETQMYRQNYKYADGGVEFVGDPVEVRKDVKFVVMEKEKRSGLTRTKFSSNNNKKEEKMSEGKKTPCCEDLVNELIANKRTTYSDKNKEWLMTLEEDQVAMLVANVAKEPEKKEPEPKKEPKKESEVQANAEPKKVDAIELMSAEDKAALAFGRKQLKERREKMVKGIQDNAGKEIWPDDKLNVFDEDTLERVFNSVVKEEIVDFSINNAGGGNNEEQEHLFPAGIEINEK